jgi:putative flippase GtrA
VSLPARRPFPLFVLASVLSFGVDVGLFCLLRAALDGLPARLLAAHAGARAVSCVFNYLCNRHLVFRAAAGGGAFEGRSFRRYLGLVLAVWALAYLGTKLGVALLPEGLDTGRNVTIVKVSVDLLLFLLSYAVQKLLIFRAPASGAHSA